MLLHIACNQHHCSTWHVNTFT